MIRRSDNLNTSVLQVTGEQPLHLFQVQWAEKSLPAQCLNLVLLILTLINIENIQQVL